MDADATMARLIDAYVAGDAEEGLSAAIELTLGIDHGGYPPQDPRAATPPPIERERLRGPVVDSHTDRTP